MASGMGYHDGSPTQDARGGNRERKRQSAGWLHACCAIGSLNVASRNPAFHLSPHHRPVALGVEPFGPAGVGVIAGSGQIDLPQL
jgi:hypothetical protein